MIAAPGCKRGMYMSNITFSHLAVYFTLYSVVGWLIETIWCSVADKKLVSRGFLSGPWCPIYGFSALMILGFNSWLGKNPFVIFLVSMAAASVMEYVTSWILEKLFQMRWWDYSHRRFNLKGRVCLGNSLLFGFLGVGLTLFIHPLTESIINRIPNDILRVITSLLVALFVVDLTRTLEATIGLHERMKSLKKLLQELEQYQKEYAWYNLADPAGNVQRLRTICEQDGHNQNAARILRQIDELAKRKSNGSRMLAAFPTMKSREMTEELNTLRQEWRAKQKKRREENARHRAEQKKYIITAYKDITLTRMVWLFLIGSVIGYVVETLFCLITSGVLECRQGMVYGPFSQVYGFGAVLLSLCLTPLIHKNNVWMFCGSAVIGGLFEIACSLIQEYIFHSVSWQYADDPFAIFGGRTNLLYMLFWGLLGTLYMRLVYPKIIALIDRLPSRPRRFFTIAVALLLSLDMLVSAAAVTRWTARSAGIEPANRVEEYIDERFPDEMLEEIYPNLVFVEKGAESN